MKIKYLALAIAMGASVQAQAADVAIFGNRYDLNIIDNFYDSVTIGHSNIVSSLDSSTLTGIELLWLVQPAASYTASQISALSGFLAGGGRIAFMGEHGTYAPDENDRISEALAALGSHISIQNLYPDGGFRTASVLDGQIKTHNLTTGVDTYQYACFAPLLVSGPAQILMTGEDDPNQVMMAYENIGPGSVFLITDQNVWDNQSFGWPGFDNERMFENLLVADTGAPPVNGVPEPASALLVSIGLLGLSVLRRRKQQ